jgi:cell division inhibitor SulA
MSTLAEIEAAAEVLSPFKAVRWRELTPAERLRRSWTARNQLPDARVVHDRKLFPKP